MTSRTSGSCSGRTFERAGHEVSDAADGAAALASVRDSPPDRVVTDLMMPVLDGAELIRHLRCEPATAGIPILAASADIHLAGALNVAKMRNSRHEMTMNTFRSPIWASQSEPSSKESPDASAGARYERKIRRITSAPPPRRPASSG